MNTIVLDRVLPDSEASAVGGTLLGHRDYDLLVEEDCDILRPDGSVLAKFRKGVLPPNECAAAYHALLPAAATSYNRGIAAGGDGVQKGAHVDRFDVGEASQTRFRPLKKDGTVSNTTYAKPVKSGIVGYFDRSARNPYCRQTAYCLNHPDRFAAAMPLVRRVSGLFRELMPERWEAQMEMIRKTHPDFVVSDTAFTTITVNRDWQTAVHTDRGDLSAGFGVLTALRSGRFAGGYFVFTGFTPRPAINMETGDLLCGDVHEWHGNTPIRGIQGRYTRLSLVFYYREKMIECGSAAEELDRAKHLDRKGVSY